MLERLSSTSVLKFFCNITMGGVIVGGVSRGYEPAILVGWGGRVRVEPAILVGCGRVG